MNHDPSKLLIGKDGIASCPDCSRETFELFDPADAATDAAAFVLRRTGAGFERKDALGGQAWQTEWHPETRHVGCTSCKRGGLWSAFALSSDGARVE